MKKLNNILYPDTSIWESDVWEKDVISASYCLIESAIPKPAIYKTDFTGTNISSHEHLYPFEHTDEKGTKHTGEVAITHYRMTDPSKKHHEEEDSLEYPGSMEIVFRTDKSGYRSVGKESIPTKTRAAIGAKIKGIVEHHIKTYGKQFADEMKKEGTPAYLKAEGYEPGASENPQSAKAAYTKHLAYGSMFKSIAKKLPNMFHPYKPPEPGGYEDITGYHGTLKLHYR